ncbi:2-octaprenylphenol hydroxylase [Skermanella stibiiresistens SB22]|uniref:2-octaprenylphenol hydroxylase n=1 Tax=Skermanella stibiiresistens SB22 TaxID=1385369 RepID=W9GU20_9PROT|nr:2-polyprenylphenol 6-hydroxylase [Skermanella stibiiresistens]EWY37279.1 2-octaprenylphenol hydroxylase [Skermanella stibiiresistens SB22]
MIRTIRNLARLVVIMRTLGRHDALFPNEVRDVAPGLAGFARLLSAKGVPGRPGQRLAAALRDLGPSFIKLGQILSTRSDLVGEAIAADLAELQDKLPPFPTSEARRIIEAELGRPIEVLYESFDAQPVAAASIAQVHFAVVARPLDQQGPESPEDRRAREVAVKVLRPGIEQAFRRDLDLFRWLSELALTIQPRLKRLRPGEVVQIFADTVKMEMDLRMEASAASELADNFKGDSAFNVPKVNWDRTSQRVLTLERIRGIKVDEVDRIRAAGFDPDDVLAQASSSFFNQVFRDGFFHADLHPGNLFVNEDGNIAPVDFGIMGRLDRATRYYLADMLLGFLNGDYRRVAEVHFQAGYVPAHQNIENFTQACRAIGEPLLNKPLHEISIGRLLAQLLSVTEQFEMETQPQLLLLQKSMLTAEGVGRALNPDINMWELARPLIEDWMREHRGPEARVVDELEAIMNAFRTLPRVLRETERMATMLTENGLKLHPATIETLLEGSVRRRRRLMWSMWLATAVVVTALALVVG